jgi:hypothetical protein
MERDCYAVSRERWNDGRLVTKPPCAVATTLHKAIRNRRDRQRAAPACLAAGKQLMEPNKIRTQVRKKRLPAAPELCKSTAPDDQAKIQDSVFNGFDASVAARKKEKLDTRAKCRDLPGRWPPMQLEGDEVVLMSGGPFPFAQIVLACRQKNIRCRNLAAAVEFGNPSIGAPAQQLHTPSPPHRGSADRGARENSFVQRASRDADGREGEITANASARGIDIYGQDGNRAECQKIDAEPAKIANGLAANEFAADFVVRPRLSLDQDNVPARTGKMRRNRAAGDTATDDQCLGCEGHVLPLSSRNTIDRVITAF